MTTTKTDTNTRPLDTQCQTHRTGDEPISLIPFNPFRPLTVWPGRDVRFTVVHWS